MELNQPHTKIAFRVINNSNEKKMVHLFDPDFKNDPDISIECPELEIPDLSKKTYERKLEQIFKESIGGYVIDSTYIQCISGSSAAIYEPINIVYPDKSNIYPITLLPVLTPSQYQTFVHEHRAFILLIKGTKIIVELLPVSSLAFHFYIHHRIDAAGIEDVVKQYNDFIEEEKKREASQKDQQIISLNDINKKMDVITELLKEISTSVFK